MPAVLLRAIGVAALLVCASVTLGADETAPVQKPVVKVGDRWTYHSRTNPNLPMSNAVESRVTFVGPDEILSVSTAGGGRESEWHFTSEWNVVSTGGGSVFQPSQRFLKFPLRVGDRFPYAFERVATRGSNARYGSKGVVAVVGWVDITVAAGKFRALKVEADGTWDRLDAAGSGWQRRGIWYVPEVRRLVKFTSQSGSIGRSQPDEEVEVELVEFKLQ